MMYVINAAFGGFSVPEEVASELGCGRYAFGYDGDIRANEVLIAWVREHRDETDLALVEIPEEATDWEMDEYDGFESIIAVVDGRIVHLHAWDFEEEESSSSFFFVRSRAHGPGARNLRQNKCCEKKV